MGTENDLWCIHISGALIYGPDDIIAQPSRDIALDRAAEWTDKWERRAEKDPDDPAVRFVVEPWPYSAELHAIFCRGVDKE